MVNEESLSGSAKPAVQMFVQEPLSEDIIQYVLWGLEEEGIPAEIHTVTNGDVAMLGKQAANHSPLNVGIGLNGVEKKIVLHHRDLPEDKPLFSLQGEEIQAEPLRRIGANAARLVKGNPMRLNEMFQDQIKPADTAQLQEDWLKEIVLQIMMEIQNKDR